MSGWPWTERELAVLRAHFATNGPARTAALLPGRTLNAVKGKAYAISLVHNRKWTARENALIRQHYPQRGAAALADLIPGRSAQQIAVHANGISVFRVSKK